LGQDVPASIYGASAPRHLPSTGRSLARESAALRGTIAVASLWWADEMIGARFACICSTSSSLIPPMLAFLTRSESSLRRLSYGGDSSDGDLVVTEDWLEGVGFDLQDSRI